MNCKLSIITINYNNYLGIESTIRSVESQTYKQFEFIIIDGNSTDSSKEIIKKCSIVDSWISEDDKGIYDAMNKGIKISKGEYLLFLNSGDVLNSEDTLQNVISYLENYDFVYGNNLDDYNGKISKINYPNKLDFSFFYYNSLNHQATFIKRTVFGNLGLYNTSNKFVSDWELFIIAICKYNYTYLHIDFIITKYERTGISSLVSNKKNINEERLRVLNNVFPTFVNDYKNLDKLNSRFFQKIVFLEKTKLKFSFLTFIINLLILFSFTKFKYRRPSEKLVD